MKAGHRKRRDWRAGDGDKDALMRANDDLASVERLHELSTRLTAKSDLPSVLQEVLDAIIELQGADFGDVQLYDDPPER